ncbi:hypothetical protein BDR06DRAFT_978019 [Suillus hirtellus]|nr:hypothetical protein BDR06DRAFT_978019 [Suillus hirtellus]
MYVLVHLCGRAGPSAHTRGATRAQPPSHALPPHSRPFTDSQIDPHLLAPAAPTAPVPLPAPTAPISSPAPFPSAPPTAPTPAFPHFPALPIPPAPPAPLAPPNANFDTTMGNVSNLDNDDDLYSAAFHAPLGNALDHLDDNNMDTDAPHPTYDLNSPPKHSVLRGPLAMILSPTLQTSISVQPKTTGSKKKKAKSNIQEQVERVNGEIGSIQSDITSRHNLKHKCFLMKLNVKKDYHCKTKKYEYLHEACTHEAMQAATSHQ